MTVENEDVVTLDDALDMTAEADDVTETPETEEVVEQVAEDAQQAEEAQQIEEEIEALKAHDYMTKEQKELFDLLNNVEGGRDHQQNMLDRFGHQQSEYSKVVTDAQQLRSQLEPLNQIFEPIQRDITLRYGNMTNAVKQWAELDQYAQQDVVGLCKYLLKQQGKTFDELQESQEYIDPSVAKIQSENAQLKQKFEQFETQSQQMEQQRFEQERQAAIDVYRQERDTQGNLKYPLLDHVWPLIEGLAQTQPHLTVDQAYSQVTGQFKDHFGGVAEPPPKKVVTTAVDKTKAGKSAITSKSTSADTPPKTLDEALDIGMKSA